MEIKSKAMPPKPKSTTTVKAGGGTLKLGKVTKPTLASPASKKKKSGGVKKEEEESKITAVEDVRFLWCLSRSRRGGWSSPTPILRRAIPLSLTARRRRLRGRVQASGLRSGLQADRFGCAPSPSSLGSRRRSSWMTYPNPTQPTANGRTS